MQRRRATRATQTEECHLIDHPFERPLPQWLRPEGRQAPRGTVPGTLDPLRWVVAHKFTALSLWQPLFEGHRLSEGRELWIATPTHNWRPPRQTSKSSAWAPYERVIRSGAVGPTWIWRSRYLSKMTYGRARMFTQYFKRLTCLFT